VLDYVRHHSALPEEEQQQVYADYDRTLAESVQDANRLMAESFTRPAFGEGVRSFVERRQPQPGRTIIRSRTNSTGQMVYLIAATEDELLNKQNALASKSIRTG